MFVYLFLFFFIFIFNLCPWKDFDSIVMFYGWWTIHIVIYPERIAHLTWLILFADLIHTIDKTCVYVCMCVCDSFFFLLSLHFSFGKIQRLAIECSERLMDFRAYMFHFYRYGIIILVLVHKCWSFLCLCLCLCLSIPFEVNAIE